VPRAGFIVTLLWFFNRKDSSNLKGCFMDLIRQHNLIFGIGSIVLSLVCLVMTVTSGFDSVPNPADSKKKGKKEIALFVAFIVLFVFGLVTVFGH
jgi:hypothetical protein